MRSLNRASRIWLTVFIVVGIVDLVGEILEQQELVKQDLITGAMMVLLMSSLLGFFISAVRDVRHRVALLTVGALFFSWLGDTAGALGIILKISLFLMAQGCYIVAFWPHRERSAWRRRIAINCYAIAVLGTVVIVALGSGWLAVPVAIYGAALVLMALLATGFNRLTTIGAALFVLSHASLAISSLGPWQSLPFSGLVVMLTYLAAQLLLVLGMLEWVSTSSTGVSKGSTGVSKGSTGRRRASA